MMLNNRYTLKKDGFSGGMGLVTIYSDNNLGRDVVVKKLRVGVDSRRIIDELKALLKLRSKHVVQLYDVFIDDVDSSDNCLVLEKISGNELQYGGFLCDYEYLKVLWQISCGLCDIHDAGLIHRDIKPNNIMLDNEGVIKIIDFGLSRDAEEAKTKNIVGTPCFMAPELWGENTIGFSDKIDVYAFGVTALALLNEKISLTFRSYPKGDLRLEKMKEFCTGLPEDVINTIDSCLDDSQFNRPSIKEVKSSIERYLLKDKHRALVVLENKAHHLDMHNRAMLLRLPGIGEISIKYDGFEFKVDSVSGNVYLNNSFASPGVILPGCCVITFGQSGQHRKFVTFDVSNPEVMP